MSFLTSLSLALECSISLALTDTLSPLQLAAIHLYDTYSPSDNLYYLTYLILQVNARNQSVTYNRRTMEPDYNFTGTHYLAQLA